MGVKAEHRVTVVYCRVSCKGQKPDLDRQLESMQMWAVGSGTVVDEWITEIGGGMNFKGDRFTGVDGVVLQADENAALNILDRFYDTQISRYATKEEVKRILLGRLSGATEHQ